MRAITGTTAAGLLAVTVSDLYKTGRGAGGRMTA
jgi:hypothetical protein